MFPVSQAELHSGRWDGSRKDHPVHCTAVRGLRSRPPGALFGHCAPLHHHQLGERVLHMDPNECHSLPWQPGQPTDDPAVWNVLQGWEGGVNNYNSWWWGLLYSNTPKWLQFCVQEHLIPGAYKFDALITTFEMILSDCPELREISWRCVIIDEAHRLKNRNCKLLDSLKMLDLVSGLQMFCHSCFVASVIYFKQVIGELYIFLICNFYLPLLSCVPCIFI